jgi:lipid-A-disaccharide synthase
MSIGKIFISAGELSGDLHGGKLIAALKNLNPDISVSAIGGDNMANAGAQLLFHIRETSFMGFTEVVKHLPFIAHLFRRTLQFIDAFQPDVVVLIDYPGFNLRLAKTLTQRNIPVIYYIAPQVWAWHQSRVKKIRRYTREVLCILPFEAPWFEQHGVRATFVGHPLLDQSAPPEKTAVDFGNGQPLIGLFPGSRRQEVEKHLPLMVSAAQNLHLELPKMCAVVAVASDIDPEIFQKKYRFEWLTWHKNHNRQLMNAADVLIMASGTATLEATIAQKPFVVIYRLSPLSYLLGKRLIKVPFISIANLIAGKKGVEELIQHGANVTNITREVLQILRNRHHADRIRIFLQDVNRQLGEPGASQRAARIILNYLPEQAG